MTTELSDKELLYASEEDWEFFNRCIEGLPTMKGKNGDGLDKFGIPIPYSSGPHILRHFREAIEIVKPKSILEIGFNMGYSASMWLNLCDAHLVSCDISQKDETYLAAAIIGSRYSVTRFIYYDRNRPSFLVYVNAIEIDLAFIDGAHDEKSIIEDIQLCKDLNIPYLLLDDWYIRYGETQKAVAHFPELELVKDMNNLRLYKWQS